MRASWDDTYSQRDIMLAHLFTYLAIEAATPSRTSQRLGPSATARSSIASSSRAHPSRVRCAHLPSSSCVTAPHVPSRARSSPW